VALHHGYGAIESALERVARSIEGSLPAGRDWHVALLENMSLDIEGIRPRVLSEESLGLLRGLLAFRHFFRHAYAISLEAPRLEALRGEVLALRAPLDQDSLLSMRTWLESPAKLPGEHWRQPRSCFSMCPYRPQALRTA
jgi:hypothetical protein